MSSTRGPILVLGHRGMLGHVAAAFFREKGFDVATTEARYDPEHPDSFLRAVRDVSPWVVINAIGLIKQRSTDRRDLLDLNAVLPLQLRLALDPDVLLIQPSTDCVFSGRKGRRSVAEPPDATDAYGLSKAMGEYVARYPATVVVRCSIIGPELGAKPAGLLGWFLSQPEGAVLTGFANHSWNGITTLEWCNLVSEIISRFGSQPEPTPGDLVQPGTERVYSKAEMLHLFAREFNRPVRIEDGSVGEPVDRSLEPTLVCKPLPEQLRELATWMAERGAR